MAVKHILESIKGTIDNMKLYVLCEDKPGSIFRRFVDMVYGKPGFGPGVDPKNWGDIEEIVDAHGLPRIDFEEELGRAKALEKQGDESLTKALHIYKELVDKHPISGLRHKSYFVRSKEPGSHLFVVADLDNLKYLNSKLGHSGADTVIRTFGELMEEYLEHNINQAFGKISKTFHRSGDEFNAIISLQDVSTERVVRRVYEESQKLLDKFAGMSFKTDEGSARATATIGISFDEKYIDREVDRIKHKRRGMQFRGEMPHMIVGDDVKSLLT